MSIQSNQHFNKLILALAYFVENVKCSTKRAELYDIIFPKLKESVSEVGQTDIKYRLFVTFLYFLKLFQSTELNDLSSLISVIISTVSNTVELTLDNSTEALQSLVIGVLDLMLQLYKLIFER